MNAQYMKLPVVLNKLKSFSETANLSLYLEKTCLSPFAQFLNLKFSIYLKDLYPLLNLVDNI